MNLEEIYMTLFGASSGYGVKFEVLQKWFTECAIIDGRFLTEAIFIRSYERLCPNREELSQTQFIQLLGIFSRETRIDVQVFVQKFNTVKQLIINEIVESKINDEYK